MSYQSRNNFGRQGGRQVGNFGFNRNNLQTTQLYDIQVPQTGANVRVNLSPDQLDGLLLGKYLLAPETRRTRENFGINVYAVNGMRPINPDPNHLRNHILLQGEEAFEFDPETDRQQFQGLNLAKVDLPSGQYVITYENDQVLRGLSQAFTWLNLRPEKYLFVYPAF